MARGLSLWVIALALGFSGAVGVGAASAPTLATDRILCFDEAHNNYQKADEGYQPFVKLLQENGFGLSVLDRKFSAADLSACTLLMIVNPVAPANVEDWSYPHGGAFDKDEIRAVGDYVYQGGGLFLITDHMPIPGAVAQLAAVFGIAAIDGEARNDTHLPLPDIFDRSAGTLRSHAITDGRNEAEKVETVATFTGNAFMASREWQPLLVFGPQSRSWLDLSETLPDLKPADWPVFNVEGWLQAAAREWGRGRVVHFSEAAECSKQVNRNGPIGMNAPEAKDNRRFCLNAALWLAREID